MITSPSPEQAKNLLLNYKVKRTENLATAQAFVLDKASLIAKLCTTETERHIITDFESIQALPVHYRQDLRRKFTSSIDC